MVSRDDIQRFVDQIVERFQPAQVILFGSYAYGKPNSNSDVDLMVVMPHRGASPKVAARIMLACSHNFPLDLLVRSPIEMHRRLKRGDSFLQEIISKGILLHEASDT